MSADLKPTSVLASIAHWRNLNRQGVAPRAAKGRYPFLSHRTIEQLDKDMKVMRGAM